MQHLPRVLAGLIYQSLSDSQKSREGCHNYLIEVGSILPRFEAVDATNSQQALQAGENRVGIVGIE